MNAPTAPLRLLDGILKLTFVISAALALIVMTWGHIDRRIAGFHLSVGHPNEAILVMTASAFLYFRRRHGIPLGTQLQRASDFATRHRKRLVIGLVIFAFIYLARIKLFQHFTFHTGAYDLAMYDTAIRNTIHGNFMFADQLGRNFFSEHFSPILLLLCPFYIIADTPATALLAEAFFVATGILFIFGIARHYGWSAISAALMGLVYINYDFLARGVMFDFHPEMMEPAFILACILCMLKRRWKFYFLLLVLALSCKEDVAVYTFFLGTYCIFRRDTRWPGIATCVISLAWAAAAWIIIIPGAMPGDAEVSHFVASRWGHLGTGYLDVTATLLRQPFYVLERVISCAPLEMLLFLGFVPLFGSEILLLAVPGLVLNTTANYEMQATLQVHYAAPFVPFVFWAFFPGLARLMRLTRHLPVLAARPVRIHASGLVLLIIYAASTTGTGYKFHAITPHVVSRYNVMEKLEPGRTVSCETGFIPHLTRHAKPFLFPYESNLDIHYRECEFILFDQQGNPWPLSKTDLESSINAVIIDRDAFKIVAHEDGVYLIQTLKKNNAGLRKWMQSIAAQGCGSRCQPRGQDHSHS